MVGLTQTPLNYCTPRNSMSAESLRGIRSCSDNHIFRLAFRRHRVGFSTHFIPAPPTTTQQETDGPGTSPKPSAISITGYPCGYFRLRLSIAKAPIASRLIVAGSGTGPTTVPSAMAPLMTLPVIIVGPRSLRT